MLGRLKSVVAGAFLGVIGSVIATTGTHASELDDILSRGSLRVGMIAGTLPYGQLETDGTWSGYDPEVAKVIADALGVKLDIVQVDAPSRVPVLVTGKVDLVISVLGVTTERLKQIAFSRPYSSLDVVLVAAKSTKLTSYDDLKAIRTAVVRSASHAQLVEKIAPAGSSILSFDDDFAQVQAVANGQADALASSPDVVGKILKARPDFDPEIKLTLHRQFNAIGVKRGNDDLLRYVNSVLAYYTLSQPVLPELQKKYFGKPFENLPQF